MTIPSIGALSIMIFADGADTKAMLEAAASPLIRGFTTNPTLMRAAGVGDYKAFAEEVLVAIPDRPISFEVFADDFPTMELQAREIASWGRCRAKRVGRESQLSSSLLVQDRIGCRASLVLANRSAFKVESRALRSPLFSACRQAYRHRPRSLVPLPTQPGKT